VSGKVEHIRAGGDATIGRSRGQERLRVIALGAGILVLIGVYFGMRSSVSESGTLLPFQMLARDLVTADQAVFESLKQALLAAEELRSVNQRWPEPSALKDLPAADSGSAGGSPYTWRLQSQGVITHYLGVPSADASAPGWMIAIKEPEPGVPTDTAPNDEEHHRLPDGTVLHVSIWTHRFGGQLDPAFIAQPEAGGWTQVLVAPLNPLAQPFAPLPPR
jgi:hypothetical protein